MNSVLLSRYNIVLFKFAPNNDDNLIILGEKENFHNKKFAQLLPFDPKIVAIKRALTGRTSLSGGGNLNVGPKLQRTEAFL